jgi:hypothetical protein
MSSIPKDYFDLIMNQRSNPHNGLFTVHGIEAWFEEII